MQNQNAKSKCKIKMQKCKIKTKLRQVIKLGKGNEEAAFKACQAWPHHLQVGGGINNTNALYWLNDAKASKVIVTSWLFPDAVFQMNRLEELVCDL